MDFNAVLGTLLSLAAIGAVVYLIRFRPARKERLRRRP